MAGPTRMLRLLQGDVGSGKTVVALLAMLDRRRGRRAGRADGADRDPGAPASRDHRAARQGRRRARWRCSPAATRARRAPKRSAGSRAGEIGIAGRHPCAASRRTSRSAISALAVIDEQHRFGVHQRLLLADKGTAADMLVMTATPIPRTLMLTAYGDLDVSRLTEKPAGRQPIDTRTLPLSAPRRGGRGGRRAPSAGGARVYWVCPLVEESEAGRSRGTPKRAPPTCSSGFGARVGLVHGQHEGRRARRRDGRLRRRRHRSSWSRRR